MVDSLVKTLNKFISNLIPQNHTNIIWQMINGIEATFATLDYKLELFKRERNILTAQHNSSIISIASQNGFEPQLMVPSTGILNIKLNAKIFNNYGYPLYILPYTEFVNKETNVKYFYQSNKAFVVDSLEFLLPVIEGEIKTIEATTDITTSKIQKIYIKDRNISLGSINIIIDGVTYTEVKSFFDNDGLNDNKQFIVKFSTDTQNPIIIYIKGIDNSGDTITINYNLSVGELGNINGTNNFELETMIDSNSNEISIDNELAEIYNIYGFLLGSDGTTLNNLKANVGFNHGTTLLFDSTSYQNFLSKYSSIIIQNIGPKSENLKSIIDIYLYRKIVIPQNITNDKQFIDEYTDIINKQLYLFNNNEMKVISENISKYEYALSNHNIYTCKTRKYAFQLKLKLADKYLIENLTRLIYQEFSKFLYNKYYVLNIETIFIEFMNNNEIIFDYNIFCENKDLLDEKLYIISNDNELPILNSDFTIKDSENNDYQLFKVINQIYN